MPDRVLLDTNVAIYLASEHSLAARYRFRIEGRTQVLSDNDLWIAATALQHEVPVVTHNLRDFVDIPGLVVISEAPGAH